MANYMKRYEEAAPAAKKSPEIKPRAVFGERLTRNVLVAAFALACVVSAKDMALSPDKNVLAVLQSAVESEWDENLGRLVYANSTLSEAISVFSPASSTLQLHQPCTSEVADVFTSAAPYIIYQPSQSVFAAAACEVTSVTRSGDESLYTVRTYCDNGLECLYFGLSSCFVEEGDDLPALTEIGSCGENQLIFEVRKNGEPLDASSLFLPGQVQ